nr:glycosyltransferase family 4 protein [Natrialba magadii]
MAEQLGLDPAEPTLHPHGARYVDTERFSPTIPFEERDCVVGFLGRLDEEKGIRNLAAVAQAVPDEITFRFIGDGDLRGWLENELESEIEQGTVEVSGWVDHDEVPAQLNELQLLILPSQPTEGLPTVILESLACGTPVYATPVSGVPDVVKEGKTGYLMRESDPETIASRVSQIQRDEKLATVSENGRTLIEQKFSFEGAVERYRRILESL